MDVHILEGSTSVLARPVPAPRDWDNEAGRAVATYASDLGDRGYALHVESVDHGSYRPYFRKGARA